MAQFADGSPKLRSRLAILSYLAAFSLARSYGNLQGTIFKGDDNPAPGSLVALLSARIPHKWYLSWVIESKWPEGYACPVFTLESIEDGELCDWANVSFITYPQSEIPESWRWTDKQHEFNDRWMSACYKGRDAYIVRPNTVQFRGDAVTLGTRTAFGLDDAKPTKTFPNWRKVTKKMMLEFFDSSVADRDANAPKKIT